MRGFGRPGVRSAAVSNARALSVSVRSGRVVGVSDAVGQECGECQ